MESRWIPLILCLSVVETIIRPVTGTTIYNRESGLLPSFDDPENVPKDVSDTHPHYFETGFSIPVPSGVYSVFGTAVNYVTCSDLGYCYCGATPLTTTVTDDYPATENPVGTGMYTGSSLCLLAPFVAPIYRPMPEPDPDSGDCPTGYAVFNNKCIKCPTGYSRFEDKCYQPHTSALTWYEARAECEDDNADLISLDEQDFYDHIAGLPDLEINSWLGASDITTEGTFVWNNGHPLTGNWATNEPNDAFENEDCVTLSTGGLLNDYGCHWNRPGFICEKKAYSYHMAYRTLDYTYYNNQHDIERLAAEILQAKHVNPNTVTLSNWKALVVTWKIIDNETPTKMNDFQLAMVSDGSDTYVLYFYGDMLLSDITGNVRGYSSGGSATKSARVCNYLADTSNVAPADDILPDTDLKYYSNYKCGNPGVYVFKTSAASDACAGTATDCAAAYGSGMTTPNCNVTIKPMDTCTEGVYCTRDPADNNLVTLTITAKWYPQTTPYIQALSYSTWVGTGSDTNPSMEQEFLPATAAPEAGTCGKSLAATTDSIEITIALDAATAEERCGIEIVTEPPLAIKYAAKIFEWSGTGTAFGPHQMFDRPGDLVVYGICFPDDLARSITRAVDFNGASPPTELPKRSRSLEFKVVDSVHDVDAHEMTWAQIGRKYYLRVCFDRGTPYNRNVDPFGIHVTTCTVANVASFTGAAVYKFIDGGCPVDATAAPMYLGQAFQVRSSGSPNTYAYGTPTSPWCLYTGRITAARWNKFEDGLLADKLFFQCVVGFCTIMDGAAGTDEKRCHNSCDDETRKKRMAGNATGYQNEVLYTSLIMTDTEDQTTLNNCSPGATSIKSAIATIITLTTIVFVAFLVTVMISIKLIKVLSRKKEMMNPKRK